MTAFETRAPLLPDILAGHAKWQGAKPALICDGMVLTWAELDARIDAVARALIHDGLQSGDRVALVMGNGPEMVEAIFGTMRAGGVVTPLNLTVTDAAIQGMITDAAARTVIATDDQCARIDGMKAELLAAGTLHFACAGRGGAGRGGAGPGCSGRAGWTDFAAWRDSHAGPAPGVQLAERGLANIIYSSGTTGTPKGIPHTHRGRLDWAYDLGLALRYHPGARGIVPIGLYSNISWVTLLCTLLAGGTLIIMRSFSAQAFLEQIRRHRVTHAALVPLMIQRCLEHPDLVRTDLSSLQSVMSAGSPLHAPLKTAGAEAFGCGIIELYGLTEGVITTLAPEDMEGRAGSVGKPLIGTDLKIIDDAGREVPAGTPGEIVSRGRILMPGYYHRPDATREATWLDRQGRAWLRTGDIGRLDKDGFLYIVDRKKDMILSGGQNIYPADIEAVLHQHPDIDDAAVIGVPHDIWGETPLGLVVLRQGSPLTAEAVRDWTNARIGKHQRLSAVELRESLPRNPNGKLLKRELRAAYRSKHG